MFGPDSNVVNLRSSPASFAQRLPSATKIGEAPMIGITPTLTTRGAASADRAARLDATASAATRTGRIMEFLESKEST